MIYGIDLGDMGMKYKATDATTNEYKTAYRNIDDYVKEMRESTPEERKSIQEYIDKISVPTGVNFYDFIGVESSPCDNCTNNPKNGGSGICHCTLGAPVIY